MQNAGIWRKNVYNHLHYISFIEVNPALDTMRRNGWVMMTPSGQTRNHSCRQPSLQLFLSDYLRRFPLSFQACIYLCLWPPSKPMRQFGQLFIFWAVILARPAGYDTAGLLNSSLNIWEQDAWPEPCLCCSHLFTRPTCIPFFLPSSIVRVLSLLQLTVSATRIARAGCIDLNWLVQYSKIVQFTLTT